MIHWDTLKTAEQIADEAKQAAAEQVRQQRQAAYEKESDPLFMEVYRKRLAGANSEADTLEAQGQDKVAEIKERYPWPE